MYYSNDNIYSGQWKQDKIHGYGEYYWKVGRIFVGNYVEDLKEGFGMHYWKNPNRVYVGFWKENKQHGVGCVIGKGFFKYGTWQNGNRTSWIRNYTKAMRKLDYVECGYSSSFPKNMDDAKEIMNRFC